MGADRIIDYTAQDFTKDGQRYDAVIDAVGKSTFGRCRRLLKPGGLYLSSELGPPAPEPDLALITPMFRGKKVMFAVPKHDQDMIRYFKRLSESGEFKPVIDRRYPLEQIVEAYRYVETGHKIGNVAILVEPQGDQLRSVFCVGFTARPSRHPDGRDPERKHLAPGCPYVRSQSTPTAPPQKIDLVRHRSRHVLGVTPRVVIFERPHNATAKRTGSSPGRREYAASRLGGDAARLVVAGS